jgi:hypothetical protein
VLFGVGLAGSPAERASAGEQLDRVGYAVAPGASGGENLNFGDEPGQLARSLSPLARERLDGCRAETDPDGVMHRS